MYFECFREPTSAPGCGSSLITSLRHEAAGEYLDLTMSEIACNAVQTIPRVSRGTRFEGRERSSYFSRVVVVSVQMAR